MRYANYYHPGRVQNESFSEIDRHHKFNPTYTNRSLRESFLKMGIELNNPDLNVGKEILFNLYHDGQNISNDNNSPNYLIATENPLICPKNANEEYLKEFTGVFTWNTNLSALKNVIHLFIPNQILLSPFASYKERKIFSCIINANKGFPKSHKDDLYKERIKVIRWYEKNQPLYFSLYGIGWNKPEPAYTWAKRIDRRMQRLASQLFNSHPFPSYAGEIESKEALYSNVKFAYCYENVANLPDYISEKIFDCFIGGCVPIYWGSNTIQHHIPNTCFIDRRDFNNTDEVHRYISDINEHEYEIYQENIRQFLLSPKAMEFDISRYVSVIANKILKDLNYGQ